MAGEQRDLRFFDKKKGSNAYYFETRILRLRFIISPIEEKFRQLVQMVIQFRPS